MEKMVTERLMYVIENRDLFSSCQSLGLGFLFGRTIEVRVGKEYSPVYMVEIENWVCCLMKSLPGGTLRGQKISVKMLITS